MTQGMDLGPEGGASSGGGTKEGKQREQESVHRRASLTAELEHINDFDRNEVFARDTT
jgi:hypothetical protein